MKRPTFLTIWLSLMTLSAVMGVYSTTVGKGSITQAFPNVTDMQVMILTLLALAQVVAVGLLWKWSKMGFYLIVGYTVVGTLFNMMTFGTSTGLMSSIFGLIGLGILYLAMKPVWKNFK